MARAYIRYLVIITIALSIISGCAQKPAVIKGKVTDEEGKALAGAALFSVPQRYSCLTDTAGEFMISGVEAGQYSLLAKLGNDSTLANLGLIEPGQVMVIPIVIKKAPPPPPPPPPQPPPAKVEEKPQEKPKPKEPPFVDPIHAEGTKVLLLADKEFVKNYEVESSDNIVWEFKNASAVKPGFVDAKLYEGWFSGATRKYYETAAQRCIYDGKLWIFTHGPEPAPEGGREIYVSIPLGLPANADIDSVVVSYGYPNLPDNTPPGSVRFRVVGETLTGGIAILVDWEKIDHATNGTPYKKSIETLGDNRKIQYISLEINSDGAATGDDFLIRPLIYFSLK